MDEEHPSSKVKNGGARTAKKPKRRNIRYLDWSAEQESVKSRFTGVKQQAQDVEHGNGANPEAAQEAMAPTPSENSLKISTSLDHQMNDTSLDNPGTATGFVSSLKSQYKESSFLESDTPATSDAPSPELHISTTSRIPEDIYEFQQGQEEQKADDWPSDNIRPITQNLRYGGYPAQPAPQHRNTPLGSGRIQNTSKLGAPEFLTSCILQWIADAFELLR